MPLVTVDEAVEILKNGGVVAYPTETAYALGADATDEKAVSRVYELKNRPREKKLPVIVDSISTMEKFAELSDLDRYLSRHLHPGPLTLTTSSDFPWIGAWRISSSEKAMEIARKLKRPVVATSANISGAPPAFSPREVLKYFEVPVVDGGELKRGKMSTIFDSRKKRIVRKGAIPSSKVFAYVVAFEALGKIKPDKETEEKVREVAEEVLEIARKYHSKVILGGSVAKGTFLRDVRDIDFFFLFEPGEDLESKLELLKEVAQELGSYEISYAQHPYVKARYRGFEIELVPAYDTSPPEIYSAADRSRWHVECVRKLSQEVKEEAMLIKAFMKGIGAYGAELRVQGLSGYACEVLASRFGSLVKLLENIESIKQGVPDPVDPNRNVVASLSDETFERIKRAASAYLWRPSLKFFFPSPPPVLPRLIKLENIALVEVKKPDIFEDAVWGMLRRLAKKMEKNASLAGFEVMRRKVWVSDKCYIAFELKSPEISRVLVKGPPLKEREHVRRFREKHPDSFEMASRIYAVEEPKFRNFCEFVKSVQDRMEIEGAYCGKDVEEAYYEMSEPDRRELSDFLLAMNPWEY